MRVKEHPILIRKSRKRKEKREEEERKKKKNTSRNTQWILQGCESLFIGSIHDEQNGGTWNYPNSTASMQSKSTQTRAEQTSKITIPETSLLILVRFFEEATRAQIQLRWLQATYEDYTFHTGKYTIYSLADLQVAARRSSQISYRISWRSQFYTTWRFPRSRYSRGTMTHVSSCSCNRPLATLAICIPGEIAL